MRPRWSVLTLEFIYNPASGFYTDKMRIGVSQIWTEGCAQFCQQHRSWSPSRQDRLLLGPP